MAHQAQDKYKLQYYTGTQASIWVKDTWIEEVFGIHFQATQNIIPLFGYASTYFNAVARGRVLVQGTFEINFIDEGYLYYILHRANARRIEREDEDNSSIKSSQTKIAGRGQTGSQDSEVSERIARLVATSEGIANSNEAADALSEIMEFLAMTDLAGAKALSREITFTRENTVPEKPTSIIYDMVPFDVMGVFGNPDVARDEATNKTIRNCFLVSNEMVVGVDDQVIKERYSFIGQQHQ